MRSIGDPGEWNWLPARTPAESRRLWLRLFACACAYALWSAAWFGVSGLERLPWEPPRAALLTLLLTGGPPMLLTLPGGWSLYATWSLLVIVFGGGAVAAWRPHLTLSLVLGGSALLAWCSAALVVAAAF